MTTEAYIHEWGCSLAEAIQFTGAINLYPSLRIKLTCVLGIAILVLGFSNFIWVPMSTCFGRRPVMILSSLICAISSIWRARATSYGSFMGASV